jgi:uncharacterized Zn-binding protein involved in type VI secretion
MGMPAARVGDMATCVGPPDTIVAPGCPTVLIGNMPSACLGSTCAHGGSIVLGSFTVLIGNKPAARVTDMHVCPMVTGVVPHVGGPVLPPGCPTVLIGP